MFNKTFFASIIAVVAGIATAAGYVQVAPEEQEALAEAAGTIVAAVGSIVLVVKGIAARRNG